MSSVQWSGVFPAVTTKLKVDLSLDADAIAAGLDRLVLSGVGGVVMMGMVGENAQLSPEEKLTVLRTAKNAIDGRVPVIAGVAETSTEKAVAFVRSAEDIGVDGLMVFPCLTYKSDRDETVEFYRTIGGASGLPILLYNNPRAYGVDLTPDLLEDLVTETTIVAIKEESYDTTRVTDLFSRFGERLDVVCGVDDLILESVALGVTGWVSGMANAVPQQSVALLRTATAGDFETARSLYRILTPLYHLDTSVKLVQHIKLAEHLIIGSSEAVKPPRLKLAGEERERTISITQSVLSNLERAGYRSSGQ